MTSKGTSLKYQIASKLNAILPLPIRFDWQSQNPNSPGMSEHTGTLLKVQVNSRGLDYVIEFKDPLEIVRHDEPHIYVTDCRGVVIASYTDEELGMKYVGKISILPPSERQLKTFSGPAFVNTCFYHWDAEGRMAQNAVYVRDFYSETQVQIIPGDEKSWTKWGKILPPGLRTNNINPDTCAEWMAKDLPLSTSNSIPQDQQTEYYTQVQVRLRRSLFGRGAHFLPQKPQKLPKKKKLHQRDEDALNALDALDALNALKSHTQLTIGTFSKRRRIQPNFNKVEETVPPTPPALKQPVEVVLEDRAVLEDRTILALMTMRNRF
jgi:hypothetical protein